MTLKPSANLAGASIPDTTLQRLFESAARQFGGGCAIRQGEHALSYADLNTRANQLAHYLIGQGVARDQLVAIHLERSIELVVTVLAVLKTGRPTCH
ncbi:hypothetical protein C9I28_27370 [Pseudoduganella armeniaca]|uniref:AMP-dependent synthetase/ligase domain-containing protein n=1 Tax=Pseudoduganella armeniaca TaxID=2072590 RepID=A0A2R4CGY9_9BURK|nr:hypothetical protein C9I28_27370 [Pseudoduganella armeniaca]